VKSWGWWKYNEGKLHACCLKTTFDYSRFNFMMANVLWFFGHDCVLYYLV
jgi:hypothetical protein